MTTARSRFNALSDALKERTAEKAESSPDAVVLPHIGGTNAVGQHKPAAALGVMSEALRDRVTRLEAELERAGDEKNTLQSELQKIRLLKTQAGDLLDEFLFVDPQNVIDRLPKDRLRGGFEGKEFIELLADIEANGQNDAITVRRGADGTFEVAAGRRRLEACRRLQRTVLARVRELDDSAMLGIQFSENERRADISALERARWFSEVHEQLRRPAKDLAAQFGIDPSTFSLYLRLARFPTQILERLDDPRRLAVLPARRVMEAIEGNPGVLTRILDALDAQRRLEGSAPDAASQVDLLLRAAEGREELTSGPRKPVTERRHIVHEGRRIGTLTRNGGQWVFRFATSIPDSEVLLLTERLALPIVTSPIPQKPAKRRQSQPAEDGE